MYDRVVILSVCSLFHHQLSGFLVSIYSWVVLAATLGYILTNSTGISKLFQLHQDVTERDPTLRSMLVQGNADIT